MRIHSKGMNTAAKAGTSFCGIIVNSVSDFAISVMCPGGRTNRGGGEGRGGDEDDNEREQGHSAALTLWAKPLYHSFCVSPARACWWMDSPNTEFLSLHCYLRPLMTGVHVFTQNTQDRIEIPSIVTNTETHYWLLVANTFYRDPEHGPTLNFSPSSGWRAQWVAALTMGNLQHVVHMISAQ